VDELPDSAVVVPAIELAYSNSVRDEIDVLVIMEHAVIVVETKHHRGRVVFKEHVHSVDDRRRTEPVALTNLKAKRLNGRLERNGLSGIHVGHQVILAIPPAQLHVDPNLRTSIVQVDHAASRLDDRDMIIPERFRNRAGPVDIEAVLRILALHATAKMGSLTIGNYTTSRCIEEDRFNGVYEAVHRESQQQVLLRRFVHDGFIGDDHIIDQARATFRLLHTLPDDPWISKPFDAFEDEDTHVYVLVSYAPTGISLADLRLAEEQLSEEQKIAILRDVSGALATAHNHETPTAHRTLDPRAIEVFVEASPTTDLVATLGGWDRARQVAKKGWSAGTEYGDFPNFVAPEAINGDVTDQAMLDLYALGCLVDFLWDDGNFPSGETGVLLDDLSQTLKAADPQDREPTADEVNHLCDQELRPASPDPPPPDPPPSSPGEVVTGVVIDSRYRVEADIGKGGMGRVVRAHDITMSKQVAIKLFPAEVSSDAVLHEFRTLVDINLGAVVRVFDAQLNRSFGHFIVMEYVDGPTLRTHIRDGEFLDTGAAIALFGLILEALAEFHPSATAPVGITHRDIKPENLIIAPQERGMVLVDFGIASSPSGTAAAGSRGYRPPGAAADYADPDIDLFAVGISLHEAQTGQNPYLSGDQELDVPAIDEDLPTPMREVLRKALAPNKSVRYATAGEFLNDLREILLGDRWESKSRLGHELQPEEDSSGGASETDTDTDPEKKEKKEKKEPEVLPVEPRRPYEPTHDGELVPLGKGMSLLIRSGRSNIAIPETISGAVDIEATVVGAEVRVSDQEIRLNVRWVYAENGELWIEATEAFNSPPRFQRLVRSLRMGAHPTNSSDSRRFVELRQARIEKDPDRPRIRQVKFDALDEGAGVKISELLLAHGAHAVGTREQAWGDDGRRKHVPCMVFDEDDVKPALVAYALTRVAPLLEEATAPTDTAETDDQPDHPGDAPALSQLGLMEQVERTISLCQDAVANYLDTHTGDRYRSPAALGTAQRIAESLISRTDHLRNLLEPIVQQVPDNDDLLCVPQTQLTTTLGRYRRDTHIDWYSPRDDQGESSLGNGVRRVGRRNSVRFWITDRGVGFGVLFHHRDPLRQEDLRWQLSESVPNGFGWERCFGTGWQTSPWHLVGFQGQVFLSRWYPGGSDEIRGLGDDFAAESAALVALLRNDRND
jgi:serine/threonine protein kinase